MDSRYLHRLARGHRIEVNGEATYAAAGRWTADPERRAKWRTLERLETQTKERLADALARAGMPVRERALDVRLGAMIGALLTLLPRRLMLRGLALVTGHTVGFWQRLERLGSPADAAFLASLTAHEAAQCEFARRELAGDERSLDSVLALLGSSGSGVAAKPGNDVSRRAHWPEC